MKSIKVLAPFSQAVLLLEMCSSENYPGKAERCLHAAAPRCRMRRWERGIGQSLMTGWRGAGGGTELVRSRREQT